MNDEVELFEVAGHYGEVEGRMFEIYVKGLNRVVGTCEYRFETGRDLEYYGNVGYVVYLPYRGHHYAYKACVQLLKIIKQAHNIERVTITCNPDNIASRKTILKLGARYEYTVDVDRDHELYDYGEVQKEVYRLCV